MLSTVYGFPGDVSYSSFLALEDPRFPKGCCHHDLKAFCEIGYKSVLLNIIENMK